MKVLVVEDDADVRALLAKVLAEAGHEVSLAAGGREGDSLAAEGGFDVIVLDWSLSEVEGIQICRHLRESKDRTPVLFLTARDAVEDRVVALDSGADDYLIKPFAIEEFLARVRSLVRRESNQSSAVFTAGRLKVDTRAHSVRIDSDEVSLSEREYDLLEYLMINVDIAVSRQQIEERVWGAEFTASSNVVDVFVRRLRRKFAAFKYSPIETLRGFGYRLTR